MNPLALAVVMAALAADKPQIAKNPVLTELLNQGVKISDGSLVKLPPPTLVNGLDAASQQQRIIVAVKGPETFAKMAKRLSDAPIVTSIRRTKKPETTVRNIDLYFIAYGDWQKLASRNFLRGLLTGNQKANASKTLTAKELVKRGITPQAPGAGDEIYFFSKVTILDQVELSTTSHSVGERGADWLLIASKTDPRFDKDTEYPNQWRSRTMDDSGEWVLSPPQVYEGSAFYVKATKLKSTPDAIFIEYHMVFEEPIGWLVSLSTKLGILFQDGANTVRKKLAATHAATP